MGFWGIEIKPGKPHPYHSDNVRGKLHITQATLGLGSSKERTALQCSVGHKSPIILCSLLPNQNETCCLDLKFDEGDDLVAFSVVGPRSRNKLATLGLGSSKERTALQCSVGHKSPIILCSLLPNQNETCCLDLKFDEGDDLVAFSVVGPRSVHLSGYFVADDGGDYLLDEYDSDSYGEDIAETDSESEDDSSDFDSDDDYGDFIDDDDDLQFPPSPVPNSGVVIEEIRDDEEPRKAIEESKRSKRKNKLTGSEEQKNSQRQLVLKKGAAVADLETEDEDGFPVSALHKNEDASEEKLITEEDQKKRKDNEKKRKSTDEDGQQQERKKNENKKQKGNGTDNINGLTPVGNKQDNSLSDRVLGSESDNVPGENLSEKKKKNNKKNKKKTTQENQVAASTLVSQSGDKSTSTLKSEEKQTASKSSSQVRNFTNGFVAQELAMGKPDGTRASRGKQVSVRYIGKLQKNGKIFDSNVGRAPFKFRLGVGEVIKGWDVGVEGMRVGDKRKLVIPPAMGYGSKGAGGKIPPNAWLEFEVELLGVR